MNKEMHEQLSKMSGQELFRYAAKFDNFEFELLPSEISILVTALSQLGKKQLVAGSSLQLGSVSVSRSRDNTSVAVQLNRPISPSTNRACNSTLPALACRAPGRGALPTRRTPSISGPPPREPV